MLAHYVVGRLREDSVTDAQSQEQIEFEWLPEPDIEDSSDVEKRESVLRNEGATVDRRYEEEPGTAFAVLPIIIAAMGVVALVRAIHELWEDVMDPGLIIDGSEKPIKIRRSKDVEHGIILAIDSKGETTVHDTRKGADLTALITALSKGLSPAAGG